MIFHMDISCFMMVLYYIPYCIYWVFPEPTQSHLAPHQSMMMTFSKLILTDCNDWWLILFESVRNKSYWPLFPVIWYRTHEKFKSRNSKPLTRANAIERSASWSWSWFSHLGLRSLFGLDIKTWGYLPPSKQCKLFQSPDLWLFWLICIILWQFKGLTG